MWLEQFLLNFHTKDFSIHFRLLKAIELWAYERHLVY